MALVKRCDVEGVGIAMRTYDSQTTGIGDG